MKNSFRLLRLLRGRGAFVLFIVCMTALFSTTVFLAGKRAEERGFAPFAVAPFPDAAEDEGYILSEMPQDASGSMPPPPEGTPLFALLPLTSGDEGDDIGPLQASSFFLSEDVVLEEKPGLSGDMQVLLGPRRLEESPEDAAVWEQHEVAPGDTLSTLAKKYGVSQACISQANPALKKNPHKLSLRQVLLIPRSSADIPAVLEEHQRRLDETVALRKSAKPLVVSPYTVVGGDSLWSIAGKFNLDINTLLGCNELKDPDRLPPGATLQIPNQDGIFYLLRKGDTLKKIADRFGVYEEAILAANALDRQAVLEVGKTKLFLPAAKPITVVQQAESHGEKESITSTKKRPRGFVWPLHGRINSPFGWRRDPFSRRRVFHTGLDIKAPYGRAIVAAKSGTVVYAGWMGGYGRVVVINHGGGYTTLYAHCSRLLVRQGQRVDARKVIARCGSTGRSTGTHLHFEVRRNNAPINPRSVLR